MHDWPRVIRFSARYVVPTLIAVGIIAEFSSPPSRLNDIGVAILFSVLTMALIGVCGWVVFLWDIDRLFYRLERKIDAQTADPDRPAEQSDGSMLGRVKELLSEKVQRVSPTSRIGAVSKA